MAASDRKPPGGRTVPQAFARPGWTARPALVAQILAAREPVVVLDGVAGMGKSRLLALLAGHTGGQVQRGPAPPKAESSLTLWDIAPGDQPEPVPDDYLSGAACIVIAKRPNQSLPGLARAISYGAVRLFDTRALLLREADLVGDYGRAGARAVLRETLGWPLLVAWQGQSVPEPRVLKRFLAAELLAPLAARDLIGLSRRIGVAALVAGDTGEETCDVSPALTDVIAAPLRQAVGEEIARRRGTPDQCLALARAYTDLGQTPQAILAYQMLGRFDRALDLLVAGQSDFFVHLHGAEAFDAVLAGFPAEIRARSETLMTCTALQALKRGDIAMARRLVENFHGAAGNDPAQVFCRGSLFSADFRAFRMLMLIYEDVVLNDTLLSRAIGLLDEFPIDAHLVRGSLYNSILEFYIRSHRLAEADDVAVRAGHHYDAAGAPMLSFYISVHRAIIRLLTGHPPAAAQFAETAHARLDQVPFDSPGDRRLLALLDACISYEGGDVDALVRFLNLDIDAFSQGELWPSLVELVLHYGSQALSARFSTIAARSFLDRWRVNQLRSGQFELLIATRDVMVLQNGSRWKEAAGVLAKLPVRISRGWVLGTGDLAGLKQRDEIAVALAWLRQVTYETPTASGLGARLETMAANLYLTARQRVGVEIWQAAVLRRQRDLPEARMLLSKVLERAARLGAIAPVAEQAVFLDDLLGNERIAGFLDCEPQIRKLLRRLQSRGPAATAIGRRHGLSRQETRVLHAVCEGASNKSVANALGISEATVKFHLGNVYGKLGCRNRKQAVQAAAALGMTP